MMVRRGYELEVASNVARKIFATWSGDVRLSGRNNCQEKDPMSNHLRTPLMSRFNRHSSWLPLVMATTVAASGCATVFKGKTTPVSVTSNTPGAAIIVDGKPMGVTPSTIDLSNKTDAVITVQQNGHEESCKVVSNASLGWIVADVFLTSGLGLIIDWATHSWNNVGPNSCHVSV
jgi:hypothetical protein